MIQITATKWNTDKPKDEDVEGKLLAIEWSHYSYPAFGLMYGQDVNFEVVKRYAILLRRDGGLEFVNIIICFTIDKMFNTFYLN